MENRRPPLWRRKLYVNQAIQTPLLVYSLAMGVIGMMSVSMFSFIVALSRAYSSNSALLNLSFIAGILLSIGVQFFIGLIITNRIAGPLIRLQREMARVANGGTPVDLFVRENDLTHSLFVEYNSLIKRVR